MIQSLGDAPMCERSVYLRAEAGMCLRHADQMTDPDTKEQLRSLAAQFILRAVELESEERNYGTLH